jgi:hypothetical protein
LEILRGIGRLAKDSIEPIHCWSNKLCKVGFLRKAAVDAVCSEGPVPAIPASKALHAALRTNVLEGS